MKQFTISSSYMYREYYYSFYYEREEALIFMRTEFSG